MVGAVLLSIFKALWKMVKGMIWLVLQILQFVLEIFKVLLLLTGIIFKMILLIFSGG